MLRSLRRELARLAPYVALLLLSSALIAFRIHRTDSITYLFLAWNLFLAAVPLCASTALRLGDRLGAPPLFLLPLLGLWLLFLPNAPYILTDLLHLREKPPVPVWYDLGLLLTCAGTGLAFAYRSLIDVEAILSRWLGRSAALALSVLMLFLSGFGIYLGRFLRLNSWEALTDPIGVFGLVTERLLDPLAHPRTWGVTVLFGLLLSLGYAVVRPRRGAREEPSAAPGVEQPAFARRTASLDRR